MYGYCQLPKFISKVCQVWPVSHRNFKVWHVRLSQTLEKHIHNLSSSEKNSLAVSQLADVFKTRVINLRYLFVQHERPWVQTKPGGGTSTTKYFLLVSPSVNVNLAVVSGYPCSELSD
jgi:hypothetical protein